jgi:hypothetical protein
LKALLPHLRENLPKKELVNLVPLNDLLWFEEEKVPDLLHLNEEKLSNKKLKLYDKHIIFQMVKAIG